MKFNRLFAVGFFDLLLVSLPAHTEHFVIVAFGHIKLRVSWPRSLWPAESGDRATCNLYGVVAKLPRPERRPFPGVRPPAASSGQIVFPWNTVLPGRPP